MTAPVWLIALAVLLASSARLDAADQTILGRKLLIRNPADTRPQARRIVIDATELGSPDTVVGDPRIGGATLRVFANGATSTSQTFDLPAAQWSAPFQNGYGFFGRGIDGPVKFVRIRKGFGGTFVLNVLIRARLGPGPQPHVTVLPPDPGDDGGMVLSIAGGDRYCVSFGGAAGGDEVTDNDRVWRILAATAEPACPPGSPSGAFLDASVDPFD